MMLGLTAGPAKAEIVVEPAIDKTSATEITASSPQLHYSVFVRNTSASNVTLRITPLPSNRNDITVCVAKAPSNCWSLRWSLNGAQLESQHDQSVPAGTGVALGLDGDLPELDVYQASVLVEEFIGKERKSFKSIRLLVTRKNADLGAAALAPTEGGRFLNDHSGPIPLTLSNNGDRIVWLSTAPKARFKQDEGGGKFAIAIAGDPTAAECGHVMSEKSTLRMLPGDRVECKVELPGLEPGRYRAELSIEQSGLQRSAATAEFTVRRGWWVAALWLALGSLVGALFAFWQGSLQRRLFQEAQALDLRSSFTLFEGSLNPTTQRNAVRLAQQAVARLGEIIDELRHGSDADFKEGLSDYAVVLRALRSLANLETQLPTPPTTGQSAALESILQLLAQKPDSNAISGALEKLREELVKPESVVHSFTVNRTLASHIANMLPDTTRSAILKRTATFIQLLFGAISLALSVFVGVDALWVPSAAWGSLFDITVAILAGIAGTAAGTISLSTLAQPFAAKLRIVG